MDKPTIISIVPYKILPAKLGGEKGIALFNEYLGKELSVTAISTQNNESRLAQNYQLLPWLSNSRLRYLNPLLFFRIRKLLKARKATHLLIEHPYYGWLAWLIRLSYPITWVVHSHNIEFERSRSIGRWWWKALKIYERWVYRKSDINFFISEDDRQFAIAQLGVPAAKSYAITYGVEISGIPPDLEQSRAFIQETHQIDPDCKLLLFNGALYHHTNYDALKVILEEINPKLQQLKDLRYKILVCGKGLPDSFGELQAYRDQNIIYAGFVDDISLYFKAADLFLNPILSGGGVKTKAIEAIAYNCTVVSTELGALGIVPAVCGNQLQIVPGHNWQAFADRVQTALRQKGQTPAAFYDYYYWGKIAQKVRAILTQEP